MFNWIYPYEINILNLIQQYLKCTFFDNLSIAINYLGNAGAIWLAISAMLIITKRYRRLGLVLLASTALCGILGEGIIKNLVKRPRPFTYLEGINLLISKPKSYSFPSGHTSVAFAFACTMLYFNKKAGAFLLTIAAIFGFSRMYLYVHFPTDVLCGILLGIFSSLAVVYIYKHKFIKTNLKIEL